jgi:MscS family membrane protein
MTRLCTCLTVVVGLLVSVPAAAQSASAVAAAESPPAVAAPQSPPVVAPADPYGRESPRGTVAGFAFAAHSRDYESAARYLQLTAAQRADAVSLTRDLESLLDRYFTKRLTSMSASSEGALRDGLPPEGERVSLMADGRTLDLLLVRVDDPEAGPVWLFSSDSLARMPSFADDADVSWIERVMPHSSFVRQSVFGLSLGQWAVWLLSIVVSLGILMGGAIVAARVLRRAGRYGWAEPWDRALRWPAIIAITMVAHWLVVRSLGLAFTSRVTYGRWLFAGLVLVSGWFLWRFLTLFFDRARRLAVRRRQAGAASLMLLVERVVKSAVILVIILGLLRMAGLDMTAALAGVGLGGIALALGAQKSVENLLGGVFLLADGALAVGDFCTISNRSGWVEDVTLRSVRLRTVEQTLLSIPAGILAQTTIENFITRAKMLIQTTLPLQFDASASQVETVLEGIERRLTDDHDLESATSRVRLVNLGPAAIDLELYAYVRTSDNTTFMRVRERLLLDVFSIVEAAGLRFARRTDVVLATGRPQGA